MLTGYAYITKILYSGKFSLVQISHKTEVQLRINLYNIYSTHLRTTVYDYAVQATHTCAENKHFESFYFRTYGTLSNYAKIYTIRNVSAIRYM